MKPSESAQIEFIKDLLRKGEKRNSILAKFGAKWQKASPRTFDRRLKVATASIDDEFATISKKTEESIGKEVEARKLKIMTVAERIDFLTRIITAQTDVKKIGSQAFPLIEFEENGTTRKEIIYLTDKLKALAELNKMGGDYAPSKTDITSGGKEITIQFKDAE